MIVGRTRWDRRRPGTPRGRGTGIRCRRSGVAAACLLLGACATAPQAATSVTTAPVASIPTDGVGLPELGLRHGPAGFALPRTTQVDAVIDQPNVVTLSMSPAQGASQARWLTTRLGDGWTVQAHRGTSVVFHTSPGVSPSWEGGFTCGATACALTLRQQ